MAKTPIPPRSPLGNLLLMGVFLAFALLMLGFAIWSIVHGLHEFLVYRPVEAVVISFQPPDSSAPQDQRDGFLRYHYVVDGRVYEGVCPPEFKVGMPRAPYDVLRGRWAVGDKIRVYVDPSDPAVSAAEPRVETFPFFMLTFAAPIVLFFIGTITGRSAFQLQKVGKGRMVGGTPTLTLYLVISAILAFAYVSNVDRLGDVAAPILGALLPTAIVPALVLGTKSIIARAPNKAARDARGYAMVLTVMSLVFLAVAAVMLVEAGGLWYQVARIHNSYRTTQGTVLHSQVVHYTGSIKTWDRGVVEYSYNVDGRSFSGDRFLPGVFMQETQSQAAAQARVGGHPPGSPVTVYYDPDNPTLAVLDPTIPTEAWITSPFALIFTAAALLIIFATRRYFREAKRIAARSTKALDPR